MRGKLSIKMDLVPRVTQVSGEERNIFLMNFEFTQKLIAGFQVTIQFYRTQNELVILNIS